MDNFQFITGVAGSGKSFYIKSLIKENPSYAILCSSTGISAINMGEGVTTINSLLGYFDYQSLKESFISGKLKSRIKKVKEVYQSIAIDEVSMISREELDLIIETINQVNDDPLGESLGLILLGDFAQLQPVEGSLAFTSSSWNEFSTTHLTKVWRQDSLPFIEALSYARKGLGFQLLESLISLKVKLNSDIDTSFQGTTIFSKNQEVDNYNFVRLNEIKGKEIKSFKKVHGIPLGEWSKIPSTSTYKINCLVMILANKSLGYEEGLSLGFEYVNGDLGHIVDYHNGVFSVKLLRNQKIVQVPSLTRKNEIKSKPDPLLNYGDFEPYYDDQKKRHIIGEVEYHPLRLAYASTCHKVQGLTLDNIQVDIRNKFFGSPQMMYVALSRGRTIEGLRLIAPKEKLIIMRCQADLKVLKFYRDLEEKMK